MPNRLPLQLADTTSSFVIAIISLFANRFSFGPPHSSAAASDIYFSEYIEGSG